MAPSTCMSANQPNRGGTLSARLPQSWLEVAVEDMPVNVARLRGRGGLGGPLGCRWRGGNSGHPAAVGRRDQGR